MSAINTIVRSDSVVLISDTVGYDKDGQLLGFSSKVYPIAHLNAAIGTRGLGIAGPIFAHLLAFRATSFDDLKSNASAWAKEIYERHADLLRKTPDLDIVIGGFSDTQGPCAYSLTS